MVCSHREIDVFLFGHAFRRRQKVPHATEEALADSCSTFQIAVVQPGGILAIQRPRALQHHPRQRRSSHGSPLPPLRRALQQKSSPMNLAFVTARCCVAADPTGRSRQPRRSAIDRTALVGNLVRQGGFVHSLPAALRDPKQEHCGERDGSNEPETQSRPSYREAASGALAHGPVEPPKAIKFYFLLPQSCDDLNCRFLRII